MAAHRHHDLVAPIAARILAVGDGTDWRGVPLPCSLSMMGERDHSVNLHGNLHWLVQPAGSEKVALLVFDTAQEKFRLMAAPERPGLDPKTARSRYSDTRSWRLRETVRLHAIRLPPRSDWPSWFFAATAAVEVVEGRGRPRGRGEIFIQHEHGILAYSVRTKEWRNVSVGRSCAALLMYRSSIMWPEISFGKALRVFRHRTVSRSRSSRRRSYSSFGPPRFEGSVSES